MFRYWSLLRVAQRSRLGCLLPVTNLHPKWYGKKEEEVPTSLHRPLYSHLPTPYPYKPPSPHKAARPSREAEPKQHHLQPRSTGNVFDGWTASEQAAVITTSP